MRIISSSLFEIFRLFADVLNDLAIFLEILAPAFQEYFTVIVCVSGLCRVRRKTANFLTQKQNHAQSNASCALQSIVGVAGGATRAALTQHQARRNNMADVSAKDGSQV